MDGLFDAFFDTRTRKLRGVYAGVSELTRDREGVVLMNPDAVEIDQNQVAQDLDWDYEDELGDETDAIDPLLS